MRTRSMWTRRSCRSRAEGFRGRSRSVSSHLLVSSPAAKRVTWTDAPCPYHRVPVSGSQTEEYLRADIATIKEALGPLKKVDLYELARRTFLTSRPAAYAGA